VFGPERRALTIGLLAAVAVFAGDGMGVVPALPRAVAELHGLPLFGWAFSAFMLSMMVGTVAGGFHADARGPQAPMALGLGAFVLGLGVAGVADGMAAFLLGRALQGAGGGAILASTYVAIARGYPDHLRPRMMALFSSVWIIPAMVGPSASGAITQWLGWRYVFLGLIPFVAGTAALVVPCLGRFNVRRAAPGGLRLVWVVAAALGSGCVLAAPALGAFGPWAPWGVAGLGGATAAAALHRLLPAGIAWARPVLPAGLLARAVVSFAYFGTEAFVPLASGALRGSSPLASGLALSTGALAWIGASWFQERWEARSGPGARPWRVRLGCALLALGIGTVALGMLTGVPFAVVPLGWAIAGTGTSFCYQAGALICLAEAPPGQEGEVSGQLQLTEALSTALGTGLGGALLAALGNAGWTAGWGLGAVFAATLAVALAGVALAGRLVRPAVHG